MLDTFRVHTRTWQFVLNQEVDKYYIPRTNPVIRCERSPPPVGNLRRTGCAHTEATAVRDIQPAPAQKWRQS